MRVANEDAEKARALLRSQLHAEGVVSASEAALFRCHVCRAMLSLGANHCPECDAFVGDPHGG